jgi:enterochelin esterase-like enzyme
MTRRIVTVAAFVFCVGATLSAQRSAHEFVISPPYAPAPELTVKAGIPRGTMHRLVMKSQDSKIFPGMSRDKPGAVVPYERVVNVYVPAGYVPGTPTPFIVVQDGDTARYKDPLPPALDNLIYEKRVPSMVAVMVQYGGSATSGERSFEYDTVSDRYTTFIETEVLPKVASELHITFTTDPDGRASMGGSSGAACAWTMAWFHPELYRRVLSYSGSFTNLENNGHPEISRGAWEYHQKLISGAPAKPIRIWMHVSEDDIGANREEASLMNWVLANQHMAAALRLKGYQYRYTFSEASGHVDAAVVNHTLPSALEWLWEGYRPR